MPIQGQAQTPAAAAPRAVPSITTVGPDGKPYTLSIPTTRGDVRELRARREQLSDQLTSVSSRRSGLADELRATTDAVSKSGLQDRLRLLDQRILQLETDLATTGQQLSAAPAQLTSGIEVPSTGSDDFEDGLMVGGFGVLVLLPIALFFFRRRWRRVSPAISGRSATEYVRMERLEQGMDAIAIEIERISEGQRFVTKLLSESQAALGGTRLQVGQREKEQAG